MLKMKFAVVMSALLSSMACLGSEGNTAVPEIVPPAADTPLQSNPPTPEAVKPILPEWVWHEQTDPMTDAKMVLTGTSSLNEVEFDFPYRGKQRAMVTVTKGQNTIGFGFKIAKGQIQCVSYNPCQITLRFDDQPSKRISAYGPDSGDSTIVIVTDKQDYAWFVSELGQRKTLKTALPIYKEGNVLFEFDLTGYDAEKFAGGK